MKAKVHEAFKSEVPADFDRLHLAIYEGTCETMANDPWILKNASKLDYDVLYKSIRLIHEKICKAVYVDPEREYLDHGEER